MTALYEITDELKGIMAHLDELEEAGEITPEIVRDTLAPYFEDFESKGGNVIAYIKNLNAQAAMHKEESKRQADEAKKLGNQSDRLKDYLFSCMQGAGLDKLKDGVHSASIGKPRKVVQIDDESAIPEEYFKVVRNLSKTDLSKALKSGDVSGASLVDGKAPFTIK